MRTSSPELTRLATADCQHPDSLVYAILTKNPSIAELAQVLDGWRDNGRQEDLDATIVQTILWSSVRSTPVVAESLLMSRLSLSYLSAMSDRMVQPSDRMVRLADASIIAVRHGLNDHLAAAMAGADRIPIDRVFFQRAQVRRALMIFPPPVAVSMIGKLVPDVVPVPIAAQEAVEQLRSRSTGGRSRDVLFQTLLEIPKLSVLEALEAAVELEIPQVTHLPNVMAELRRLSDLINLAKPRVALRITVANNSGLPALAAP